MRSARGRKAKTVPKPVVVVDSDFTDDEDENTNGLDSNNGNNIVGALSDRARDEVERLFSPYYEYVFPTSGTSKIYLNDLSFKKVLIPSSIKSSPLPAHPDELLVLGKLHAEFFTIFHSKRYASEAPELDSCGTNLKKLILHSWKKHLSSLSFDISNKYSRIGDDMINQINKMIIKLHFLRKNPDENDISITPYRYTNDIYDNISDNIQDIEDLLDDFERTLNHKKDQFLFWKYKSLDLPPWTVEEKNKLLILYKHFSLYWVRNPKTARFRLLTHRELDKWARSISLCGTKRSAEEVETKLAHYLNEALEIRLMKNSNDIRPTSPTVTTFLGLFVPSEEINLSLTHNVVLNRVKELQNKLRNRDDSHSQDDIVNVYQHIGVAEKDPNLKPSSTSTNQSSSTSSTSQSYNSEIPNFNVKEQQLLGMLYRYETLYGESAENIVQKASLLSEWASLISKLGIKRDVDEIRRRLIYSIDFIKNYKDTRNLTGYMQLFDLNGSVVDIKENDIFHFMDTNTEGFVYLRPSIGASWASVFDVFSPMSEMLVKSFRSLMNEPNKTISNIQEQMLTATSICNDPKTDSSSVPSSSGNMVLRTDFCQFPGEPISPRKIQTTECTVEDQNRLPPLSATACLQMMNNESVRQNATSEIITTVSTWRNAASLANDKMSIQGQDICLWEEQAQQQLTLVRLMQAHSMITSGGRIADYPQEFSLTLKLLHGARLEMLTYVLRFAMYHGPETDERDIVAMESKDVVIREIINAIINEDATTEQISVLQTVGLEQGLIKDILRNPSTLSLFYTSACDGFASLIIPKRYYSLLRLIKPRTYIASTDCLFSTVQQITDNFASMSCDAEGDKMSVGSPLVNSRTTAETSGARVMAQSTVSSNGRSGRGGKARVAKSKEQCICRKKRVKACEKLGCKHVLRIADLAKF